MNVTTEIFSLVAEANGGEKMSDEQKKEMLLKMDKKWDGWPEGKLQCNEKSILAFFIFENAVDLSMMDLADKWVEILLMDRSDDPSQVGVYRGSLAFAKKDYTDAHRYFKMAYDDSKERPFSERNPAFLDLVKNPSKYQ